MYTHGFSVLCEVETIPSAGDAECEGDLKLSIVNRQPI